MTGLVENVRDTLDQRCLVNGGLKKRGCKVSIKGAPSPRVIVDFDKPGSPLGSHQPRCDYLFVAEDAEGLGWVAPLELKRGRLHADEVVRQLQAGACAAEEFVPSNEPVTFCPVAASGRRSKAERNKLKSKGSRVRFHGRAKAVKLISCGGPLAGALGA